MRRRDSKLTIANTIAELPVRDGCPHCDRLGIALCEYFDNDPAHPDPEDDKLTEYDLSAWSLERTNDLLWRIVEKVIAFYDEQMKEEG